MNITYICNEYPPRPHGGIGTFVQMAAHAMTRAGHRVTVVGIGDDNAERDDSGVRVVTLKRASLRLTSQFANRRKLHAWLTSHATDGTGSVVEVPDFQGHLPFPLDQCAVVVRLHLTATAIAHSVGSRPRALFRRFEERTLDRHRNWIAVSDTVLRLTTETFGLTPKQHAVVFPPITDGHTPIVPDWAPQEFLLFAGSVSRRKGALDLALVARDLLERHGELHLVFAGPAEREDGQSTESLVRALLGPGISGRVHFPGRIPHAQVLGLMSRARVFVFPSKLESFGLVVAEAMLMGCPTVTLDIGPFTEFITHDHDGLLVQQNDHTALRSAIDRLLQDRSFATRLGETARSSIRARCSEEAFVNATTEFYQSCIDAHTAIPQPTGGKH